MLAIFVFYLGILSTITGAAFLGSFFYPHKRMNPSFGGGTPFQINVKTIFSCSINANGIYSFLSGAF